MKIGINPEIDVNLDNGVYLLGGESANGKTYLLTRLLPVRAFGLLLCRCVEEIHWTGEVKLAIFDRADTYLTSPVFLGAVAELAGRCPVLVDTKSGYFNYVPLGIARIRVDKITGNIEVKL